MRVLNEKGWAKFAIFGQKVAGKALQFLKLESSKQPTVKI